MRVLTAVPPIIALQIALQKLLRSTPAPHIMRTLWHLVDNTQNTTCLHLSLLYLLQAIYTNDSYHTWNQRIDKWLGAVEIFYNAQFLNIQSLQCLYNQLNSLPLFDGFDSMGCFTLSSLQKEWWVVEHTFPNKKLVPLPIKNDSHPAAFGNDGVPFPV